MNADMSGLLAALPEIFVGVMACVILLVDVYLPPRARAVSYGLAQLTLVVAAGLTLAGAGRPGVFLNNMFIIDPLAVLLKLAIYALTFFVFAYSRDYLRERGMLRGEYFVLGLFGV